MKRFAALLALAMGAGLAVLVGSAAAGFSGLTVTPTASTVTFSGTNDDGCDTMIDVVDDATQGDAYDQSTLLQTLNFSSTFTGLQPATLYDYVVQSIDAGTLCDDPVFGSFTTPSAGATVTHSGPDRYVFCAVAGNTDLNGNAIAPGTSLNILLDQATSDPHYMGATPGFWVPGEGATCSLTPEQAGLAAASTTKVNHVGGTGDINQPEVYTLVG